MLNLSYRGGAPGERGQVIVLFALLVPVIFAIGSITMSVGNWYVLKRHLQTQVDAAVFAGGAAFTGCGQDPIATNMKIAQKRSSTRATPSAIPLGSAVDDVQQATRGARRRTHCAQQQVLLVASEPNDRRNWLRLDT